MNIGQIIKNRYSVKKFDGTKKLSEEQIGQIKDLLQSAPSSVNIQPWHFTIATSDKAREAIAKSTKEFGFNDDKIKNASALIVFSVIDIPDQHFVDIIEQEDADQRYSQEDLKIATDNGRRYFYNLNKEKKEDKMWLQNQVYLSAGYFTIGASIIGIDSVIMEGFDPKVLKEQLKLENQNPVLIVAVGTKAEDDYNAKLKKSRLDQSKIIDII